MPQHLDRGDELIEIDVQHPLATVLAHADSLRLRGAHRHRSESGSDGGAVGAEELPQLLRVELGLLERREVAASRRLGRADDVRGALEPGPRRAHDVAGEEREAGRHLDAACSCSRGIAAFAWYIRMDDADVAVSQ